MTVAVGCSALLGFLLFGLGLGVSLARQRTGVGVGCDDDPTSQLFKLVRAHGNTAEYAPMLAVLMLIVGANDPPVWALFAMALAVLSRYALAIGMLSSPSLEQPHPLRVLGATGTYAAGLALCIAALLPVLLPLE